MDHTQPQWNGLWNDPRADEGKMLATPPPNYNASWLQENHASNPDQMVPSTLPEVDFNKQPISPSVGQWKYPVLVERPPSSSLDGTSSEASYEKELVLPPETRNTRRKRIWILAVALLIIAAAVGVPLGILLPRRVQESSTPTTSSAPAAIDSSQEVLNGTGISSIGSTDGSNALWLVWQNSTGDIRLSQLSSSGHWSNSQSMNISNALKGTTLTTGIHQWPANLQGIYHLIYQTTDGYYSDLIRDPSIESSWSDGGLNSLKVPWPSSDSNVSSCNAAVGNGTGYFYIGGPNTGNWEEWAYDATVKTWNNKAQSLFNTTAFSGCTARQVGFTTILHVLTPENGLVSWYRDAQYANASSNWAYVGDSVNGLWPNSSLASVGGNSGNPALAYYQNESGYIQIAQASGTTAQDTWIQELDTNVQALGGSSLHAAPMVNGSITKTHMFFQREGNDIAHYVGTQNSFQLVDSVPMD